jgi:hypothetical protein
LLGLQVSDLSPIINADYRCNRIVQESSFEDNGGRCSREKIGYIRSVNV